MACTAVDGKAFVVPSCIFIAECIVCVPPLLDCVLLLPLVTRLFSLPTGGLTEVGVFTFGGDIRLLNEGAEALLCIDLRLDWCELEVDSEDP